MSYLGQVELKSSEIRRVDVTGSTSATHTLTWTPASEQSLIITINGIKQQNNYSISGTTLTLDDALLSDDKMEVIGILDIGEAVVPPDDSITTAMVKDDAIDADKLANSINTEIAANTAKVTNATHTGDVTGATALTIAADAVDIAMLSATGTADATTFLRGDNAWAAAGSPSITDNGSSVTAMTINADGTINYPLQSCFRARITADQSNVTGAGTQYSMTGAIWTEDFDLNGDFSNGTFTAPVNGHYYLAATTYLNQTDGCTDMTFNMVTPAGTHIMSRGNWSYSTGGTGYASPSSATSSISQSGLFYIAAAGTAYIILQGYNQGSDSVDVTAFHTFFSGALVA